MTRTPSLPFKRPGFGPFVFVAARTFDFRMF
jgi:hypothetical protein